MTNKEDKLLVEVKQVLKNDKAILESCRKLLSVISPAIDAISINVETSGLDKRTVLRCIIKRAQENLETVVETAESDHPHMSTMMLRPLCEDLIYGAWLRTLPDDDADKLVLLSTSADIMKSILAQNRFLPKAYAKLGRIPGERISDETLSKAVISGVLGFHVEKAEIRYELTRRALKQLGLKIGWPGGRLPSIHAMANQANLSDVYDFFYHGSSKAVHSSLHNMSRMVWGDPKSGIFTIDSHRFEKYFVSFALIYGVWLTADILDQIAKPEFPDEFSLIDEDSYDVWLTLVLGGHARRGSLPPLVTRAEIWWPNARRSNQPPTETDA